jgi:putative mRNA 3-end processing factor
MRTVRETGARRVIGTHGNTDAILRALNEEGIAAEAFATHFGDEE